MIIIDNWGRLSYRKAWERQKELFRELQLNPDSPEYIISVEHDPVYTLGFHGNESNLLVSEEYLNSIDIECVRIERGGDITYHGPGQLVIYPIVNLHKHKMGVKKYIECIEYSVIELLSLYNIKAECNSDAIGVWIDWNTPDAKKICAIGVKVSHGITMHGLALNVNTDIKAYDLINPCGFSDKGVISMASALGHKVDFNEVSKKLKHILAANII